MKSRKRKLVERILLLDYNKYYRMVVSCVKSREDALDIVQSGALKAIGNCASLKKEAYAGTWIYRIMMNEMYRFLDKSKESPIDEVEERGAEDVYGDIDLRQALELLPLKDKVIIELRFFEDMTFEDIAEITGESLSTVKSRLYRSLKKLRLTLE